MTLTALTALSPLDGRYQGKVDALRNYFSEYGLIRYRVLIEIEWFKALSAEASIVEIAPFSATTIAQLDRLAAQFSEADAEQIKAIEKRTNHDVKAIDTGCAKSCRPTRRPRTSWNSSISPAPRKTSTTSATR